MSKNITIQEGGTSKQMTVSKLKTDKVGGGTCLWVPEEEVALGTKSISQNGTYKASDDGKYGFSQVTVNVAGAPGSADSSGKPISSGGNPTIGSSVIGTDPTDGKTYEYSVAPNGDVTKTPTPSVEPSGAGSSIIGIDPSDGETYEYSVDSQGGVTKTLVPTITPGGPGSGVVGTDPEDGNEYFIGINQGGNIVKTKIPSGIEIGKEPNKTTYTEGEAIDYSGIIVTLKSGDGTVLSNSDYPNGRIPFSELIFTETNAYGSSGPIMYTTPADDTSESYVRYGITFSFIEAHDGLEIAGNTDARKYTIISETSKMLAVHYPEASGNYERVLVISQDPFMVEYQSESGSYTYQTMKLDIQTANGKNTSIPIQDVLQTKHDCVEEDMIKFGFGVSGGNKEIPVQWKSPYDGRTFDDTFEITVTRGNSGTTGDTGGTTGNTSSGSGYSDDSGGSSSGGGTNF